MIDNPYEVENQLNRKTLKSMLFTQIFSNRAIHFLYNHLKDVAFYPSMDASLQSNLSITVRVLYKEFEVRDEVNSIRQIPITTNECLILSKELTKK